MPAPKTFTERSRIMKLLDSLEMKTPGFAGDVSIVLAAGHGKRIKSNLSKMLHPIWGQPTVLRVINAARKGLADPTLIVTVGIKAEQVASTIGRRENLMYAYQESPNGTGHAVKVAVKKIPAQYKGLVFIFAGDMGLLKDSVVRRFREYFKNSAADMCCEVPEPLEE